MESRNNTQVEADENEEEREILKERKEVEESKKEKR
jgi:hypothetical protein